jgi:putative holliday junction resolvase
MSVGLLTQIIDRVPKNKRLLGLDIGTTTIGMAVGDQVTVIATPIGTLKRTKFTQDVKYLEKIIQEYEIMGFVIGLPLNTDGTEGPRCQSVRDFATEFSRQLQIRDPWIALWDERFSTVAALDSVSDFVKLKKAKEKGFVDKLAAQNILQGALEFIKAVGY